MSVFPRLAMAAALHRQGREGRFLQMATVDPQGYPHNRTVVFRGWQGECRLILATDRRSPKIDDLEACPYTELCWYFSKTREQFRLFGRVELLAEGSGDPQQVQTWVQTWQQISASGQDLWFWPDPAQPLAPLAAFAPPEPAEHSRDQPPSSFVVLIVVPETVDHLKLRGDGIYPQTRTRYTKQGSQWSCQGVNP